MKRKWLWLIVPLFLSVVLIAASWFLRASRASAFERKLEKLSRADRIEMHEATWTTKFPLNARQVREIIACSRDFERGKWPQQQKWTHFNLKFYAGKQLLGFLECAPICPDGCSGANHGSTAKTIFVDGYELRPDSARQLIQLLSSQNGDA